MVRFKFLHAADLHLDSPLIGLAGKSAEFADRVQKASRRAFDNLITLAIEEKCRFVVLAGDVFDGDLRNFQTVLFFLSGLRRLREARVRVFLIAGNHDAENRFADKLNFSENVYRFSHRKPESVELEDIDVAVHGQSFGQRDVSENIALNYPAPYPNRFNIGVLHTACAGSEGHHKLHAPCSLEQLVNHGYQYWALGHVHTRAVLSESPHVVYPGNLQGRDPRETGPKGATLVEVADGEIIACGHRDLDEVRWALETVDISGVADRREVMVQVQRRLTQVCSAAGDRPVALRLQLCGESPLHGELLLNHGNVRDDVDELLTTLPIDVWLEKLELGTCELSKAADVDPTVAGQLEAEVRRFGGEPEMANLLEDCLAEVKVRMPAGARANELFGQLRAEAPARAVELALALVGQTENPPCD